MDPEAVARLQIRHRGNRQHFSGAGDGDFHARPGEIEGRSVRASNVRVLEQLGKQRAAGQRENRKTGKTVTHDPHYNRAPVGGSGYLYYL